MTSAGCISTRFLILSDTHGETIPPEMRYEGRVDVAIHCGDLTDGSKLHEFHTTLEILKAIDAPLKLVIAGNHDFTMDIPMFRKKVVDAGLEENTELVASEYGDYGRIRQLFEEARAAGIVLLDEGTHRFTLENGALLTVYASPFTPSLGEWGFQYHPNEGHTFSVDEDVDVVITHGPPKGVLDYTVAREQAGCSDLFSAVVRARPLLHCFGHIHEGWGAKFTTWRPVISETPSHFRDIDNERSFTVESLSTLKSTKFDTAETSNAKSQKLESYTTQRCCPTSHCRGDAVPIRRREQTLFVNASISGTEEYAMHLPWVVDIELERAKVEPLADKS